MHEIQMLGLLEHDVLPSIEVPYLKERTPSSLLSDSANDKPLTKDEADRFDMDIFATRSIPTSSQPAITATPGYRPSFEKRISHRNSIAAARIATIEESPKAIIKELPPEGPSGGLLSAAMSVSERTTSPAPSIRSVQSDKSTSSTKTSGRMTISKGSLASKLAPAWLFNPFRSGPSEPQTSQISASASSSSAHVTRSPLLPPVAPQSPLRMPAPVTPTVQQIMPVAIKNNSASRSSLSRTFEEETLIPQKAFFSRRSPINSPPREEGLSTKRRSSTNILAQSLSSSSGSFSSPSQPEQPASYAQMFMSGRWQHVLPQKINKHEIKWKSLITPSCLPLTVEHFPSTAELESSYDVFSYDFVVDPEEMKSFLVKPPSLKGSTDEMRRAWALVVMRGMAAVRLAQGFQFVLKSPVQKGHMEDDKTALRRSKTFVGEEKLTPAPVGAADVLRSTAEPVYLSITKEIHRISFTGEAIQMRRYVRRMIPTREFEYQCLIWPKLGGKFFQPIPRALPDWSGSGIH
jgi:hypothetical protein